MSAWDLKECLGGAVPAWATEGWARRGIERALPFQKRVLRETGILAGRNTLVLAPASAGKTLPAEAAIARALGEGRKAFYLAPTRALAEEKSASLSAWLAPAGRRVLCATRDRPESDAPILAGAFDAAVAVYEKLNHYLLISPNALAGAGVVVIDEIQMLGDAERGALLDLLILKLKLSPYRPQLVALGPELREAAALARWLGADLAMDRRRARELKEGVLDFSAGAFRFRGVNSEEEGCEPLAAADALERIAAEIEDCAPGLADPRARMTLAAAAYLARRGEQAIIFAPTRRASRDWAAALAEIEPFAPAAGRAIAELARLETGAARESLAAALARGAAYHNSDLPQAARAAVERAFNAGEVRLLVSTPTLGLGVNLAAENVFHYPARVAERHAGGRAAAAPLGKARFAQQGGRAARYGMGEGAGRSILVAADAEEAARLWREFIEAELEPLAAPLAGRGLAGAALDLLGGGVKRTAENLAEALGETFSAAIREEGSTGGAPFAPAREDAARALAECEALDLAAREPGSGLWRLTGLGESAAALGLAPATMADLRRMIEGDALSLLAAPGARLLDLYFPLALTAEGRRACEGVIRAPRAGRSGRGSGADAPYAGGLAAHADELPAGGPARAALAQRGGPSREELRALAAAAALEDWAEGVETELIEEAHGVCAGGLARLAGEMAWLAAGLAAAGRALGAEECLVARLESIRERTAAGVAANGIALARLRSPLLGRGMIARLARGGIDTAEAALEAGRSALADSIGLDAATELEAAARARVKTAERPSRIAPARTKPPEIHPQITQISQIKIRKNGRSYSSRSDSDPPPPDELQELRNESPEIGLQSAKSTDSFRAGESADDSRAASLEAEFESADPPLVIDPQSPGLVRVGAREVMLPPLGFDFLAALAERPGEVVTRQALYQRLWPEGGPEEQQLDGHRRAVLKRLAPALGRDRAASVAEVVRGIGFRMTYPVAKSSNSIRTSSC